MNTIVRLILLAVALALPATTVSAQAGFEWLPPDGCEILLSLERSDVLDVVTMDKSQEEWRAFFADEGLPEAELNTLAAYLAIRGPVAESGLPASPADLTCEALPMEGRQLLMEQCQNCHSIGPVVLMGKQPVAWVILMEGPTHGVLELTEEQMQAIAHYLHFNAPVPEEDIPQELNQPLQGY